MAIQTDDSFLLLAATLINSLPSSSPVSDILLIQLHAVFGPMLLSALQLIDRREVVTVRLPGGREVYQVTSSSGQPYTLYITLPPLLPAPPDPPGPIVISDRSDERSPSPTPVIDQPVQPSTPPPPSTRRSDVLNPEHTAAMDEYQEALRKHDTQKSTRIRDLALGLERMYCPCAGFLYNSIGGERNYLCKHLLAAIIAHHTVKTIHTEVDMAAVMGLLDCKAAEG